MNIHRSILLVAAWAVSCTALAAKQPAESSVFSSDQADSAAKPWTSQAFLSDPEDFQFAVIGDRTGGGRPGVLPAAVDLLNLLRPEFVVNVGDLIEGYVEDEAQLKAWWKEIDEDLQALDMPFFMVPGNHDVNLDPSEKVWFDRVGADRSYAYFIYRNVLFLLISTEDPPKNDVNDDLEEKYEQLKAGTISSPEEAAEIIEELETWAGSINISDAQVKYFKDVLNDHPNVRWTIGFMHSPAWMQADPGNFAKIESLLADRPYTMFAGHTHNYNYLHRNGRDHITMATTGAGVAGDEIGHMDHVAWVTMTDEGPVVGNLLLNGILDKRGAVETQSDFLIYRPRQITRAGRSLGLKSVPNLRDLGGYKTRDGETVRAGLAYRANQLHHVSAGDMEKLAQLGLKNSYDLRTLAERAPRPDELPPGVACVWLDVLADSPQAGPAMLEQLMTDAKEANKALGGGKAEEGFTESYREFVSLKSANLEFRKLFLLLGEKDQLPALFHCTTGKDRTGWSAAALLTLLGVPRETVMEDYLRSNDYILPMYKEVIDGFVSAGGEERIPLAILGVKEEYLNAAFDEMEKRYATIEKYFSEGLGIDAAQQQALKDIYLGRPSVAKHPE